MAKQESMEGFSSVDRTADPGAFVRYLETASALESVQRMKRRTFEQLAVKAGSRLLDVGCGLGDDVRTLSQMVGSTGWVVGVDSSEAMITEARKRTEGLNLPVEFRTGDVQRLDFADNTFDGCRAERVLIHVEDPRQALAEMVRVARSGAHLVVLEPDMETAVLAGGDRAVTRKLLNFLCDNLRNGWMGRHLLSLFHEAGLEELVTFAEAGVVTEYALAAQMWRWRENAERAQEAGVVSATEATEWLGHLEEASQAGRFFGGITFFCVSGKKP
jgi:ubiquinone/menaquinone biosynthesis C-methylase UbiE